MDRLRKLESKLGRTVLLDRQSIRKEIRRMKRSRDSGEQMEKTLVRLEKRVQTAIKRRTKRIANRPKPVFDGDLPIIAKQAEIIEAIKNHPVVIVSGDTGSGKSTQLPKFCLAAGRGGNGLIGCTQPRRIAAMTISRRIAEELGEDLGQSVGYKIRFQDKTRPSTYIKIMTDGILLAETQSDPTLFQYDTIIVDEAHERSLNVDFLLGILKKLIKRRKDLRLIITSATIDTEKFSNAFDQAPIIEVSGRMYPVEVKYTGPDDQDTDQTHVDMAVDAADRLLRETVHGDMLIFMPTEQDIRETCEILVGKALNRVAIFPLFARLSASDQSKIFRPSKARKIVVATNVAETSLTIPGIRYVIDTGLARISQYSPRTRTTSLPVTDISQSSADQRAGRCGRIENGICIRLFSEESYTSRAVYTPPEILRSNLAEVILRMLALRLGEISDFPFIDSPDARSINDGFDLLQELGAIEKRVTTGKTHKGPSWQLSQRGELMARLPIDPRLSRMLIQAKQEGCLKEILVIAAALSIQDPRERPAEKAAEADAAHKPFHHEASDFLALLNIWSEFQKIYRTQKTWGNVKRFCKAHFLSFRRMREWQDIHGQLAAILKESGFWEDQIKTPIQKTKSDRDTPEAICQAIHRSVLSGFLSNIAQKKEANFYRATKGREAMIFPGSGLFNHAGQWVMAAEMVETSRLFARCVANIDSAWIAEMGKTQCTYTYLNPRWSKKRGAVIATEQVSLYGLIISADRSVSYGPINPEEASEIFIREALVPHNIKEPFSFITHNRALIESVTDMENRFRRRDILTTPEDLAAFYKDRIPLVYDVKTLKKEIKKRGGDRFLKMTKEMLCTYHPDQNELDLYPDTITLGQNRYACDYRFDPGKNDDGVTVKIPMTAASAIPAESIDWIVPGLFKEKLASLIRALPKRYRRQLVPIASNVEIIAKEMPKADDSLATTLSRFILKRFRIEIPASAWQMTEVPDHLKMRLALTDPIGKEVMAGRDKRILSQEATVGDQDEYRTAVGMWERDGITRWDFNDLPETVQVKGNRQTVWTYFPALKEDETSVGIRVFRRKDTALDAHLKGVAKLLSLQLSGDLKFLKRTVSLPRQSAEHAQYFGGLRAVEKQLFDGVVEELFQKNIRNRDAFSAHINKIKPILLETGRNKRDQVLSVLKAFHETRITFRNLELNNVGNPKAVSFLSLLENELNKLVPDHFITLYSTERLPHLSRYLKALTLRAERGITDFEKDAARAAQVEVYTTKLNELLSGLSRETSANKRDAIESLFWLIEEYKVSLFAQEIKTAVPISKKRLEKKLKEIEQMV